MLFIIYHLKFWPCNHSSVIRFMLVNVVILVLCLGSLCVLYFRESEFWIL